MSDLGKRKVETLVEATEESAPAIVVQFAGEGSADATISITGGISELMLFGVSEMLKQYAYELMAQKAMQRQMEEAKANDKGIVVPFAGKGN